VSTYGPIHEQFSLSCAADDAATRLANKSIFEHRQCVATSASNGKKKRKETKRFLGFNV